MPVTLAFLSCATAFVFILHIPVTLIKDYSDFRSDALEKYCDWRQRMPQRSGVRVSLRADHTSDYPVATGILSQIEVLVGGRYEALRRGDISHILGHETETD